MKKLILISTFLISQHCFAQQVSELKTFKSKEAKTRHANLFDLKLTEGGAIELTSVTKKDKAEKLSLSSDLVLLKMEEIPFDPQKEAEKERERWAWRAVGASEEILKADVLEVASTDALSKAAGINTINKGKLGLKSGLGFSIQKGDVKLVTNVANYGTDDMRGNRTRTFTVFVPKDEIKLKSDEGKNIVYEFHSSKAEALQVAFVETDSRTTNSGYGSKSSNIENMKAMISQEADLLLIGNRRPIVKFGKAPSAEDMLPVYYVYKISPKAMDIVAQTKFSEPVARGIIYRETLKINGGVILVSAPTSLVKPNDPNPRNYVFRLIGDDTQLKFEFTHEVPSGFTQFSQAIEMPDGSIILMGALVEKRFDKYFNQGTTVLKGDGFYSMTIKDGKVIQSETINDDAFFGGFKTPAGEQMKKESYNTMAELTKNVSNQPLPNGGMLSVWSLYYPRPENNTLMAYTGDIAFQFSATGKLEARYWNENKNKTKVKPPVDAEIIKKSDTEFYWLTYTADETGNLATPAFTKIDTNAKTLSAKTSVGDEKHFVSQKFTYIQSENKFQFFGFDQGGKEFWTQTITLK